MKIGILTSSRADFGSYIPLLKRLFDDVDFQPEIIAFGTHLSDVHGNTIVEIENNNFKVNHRIETIPGGDSPYHIACSIGETIKKFASFWDREKFDLVFALGDRYEMFAAVVAGSPFNVKFAHLHAGETTLGAIDNAYRHGISLMSEYLFVSTEEYRQRAIQICDKPENTFNVGALTIENLKATTLYTLEEFKTRYDIDLSKPTILTTFQPETISYDKNEVYIANLLEALGELNEKYQIIITMPNYDTSGLMIRNEIQKFALQNTNIFLVESFGMKGYLSCVKYCSFLLGNTSSGFLEASFFPKFVINLGDRQKGRIQTPNIYSVPILKDKILETVKLIEVTQSVQGAEFYGDGNTSEKILKILKKIN
jgi:GDP/UDP-N,N'-diacetylbacillosamine 2-epimerase (hydrolysing)